MSILTEAVIPDTKPTAAGFKTVYVGKDKFPLSVLEIVHINGEAWMKSSSFKSLSGTIKEQMNVHSKSDLISIISREIPIDVNTTFMESTQIKESIVASMTGVENLSGLDFLHSGVQKYKSLASYDTNDHISDLACIKLGCCLADKNIDVCIV